MSRPPRRRKGNDAKTAIRTAAQAHAQAQANTADVDAVALAADMLTRRSDRFVREVERALRRP